MLREHIAEYGTAPDGRFFRSKRSRGAILSESTYGKVRRECCAAALGEKRTSTPLAKTPYDLRHGVVSLCLGSGVDATDVAARAGHSVDLLPRVYAKCIYGRAGVNNQKIEQALDEDLDDDEE